MKLRNYFAASVILASFAALAISCTNEMDYENRGISEITATIGDGTSKTVLADNMTSILWSPNDEISVFFNGVGHKFTALNSNPTESTVFASDKPLIYGRTETSDDPYLYAVYPYSYNLYSLNKQEGDDITLMVTPSQLAVEGSFGIGAFPSVGRSKDTNIAFYNICGGIRFSLTQEGIRKIVLKGNNDEDLAGYVKVRFDEDNRPKVAEVVDGWKSIDLYAPVFFVDGEFQTGKWYYISALPASLSKGFSMTFFKRSDESEYAVKNVSSPIEIKRSVFGSIDGADKDLTFEVGVAKLEITPEVVSLAPMSVVQLLVDIYPSDAQYEWIKWSSSDKTIATVDEDGMVVGKAEGKCTIIATSDNGKSASCTVYVSDLAIYTLVGSWTGIGKTPWGDDEDVSFYVDVIDEDDMSEDARIFKKTHPNASLIFSDIKFGSGMESEKDKEIFGYFDDNTNKMHIYPNQPFNSYIFTFSDGGEQECYVAITNSNGSEAGNAIFSFDKDANKLIADVPVEVGVFSRDDAMDYYGPYTGLATGFIINKMGD